MKKSEYRKQIRDILDTEVDDADVNKKASLIRQCVVDAEKTAEYDSSNKRKPYTDDELRVIFSMAPTNENCVRLAKSLKRGVGGIQQIYQWASTSQTKIDEVMPDSTFHKQIKRVAKEMGWIL